MKSSDYWKGRFQLLEESQNRKGQQCYAEIEKQYRKAQKEIESQLASWYQRFADNNNITLQEAQKMLTKRELAEFKWDVNDYIRYGKENAINGKWVKQLENASARYHISRLEALKIQTQQHLEVMFGNQLDSIDKTMKNIYTEGYYRTAFEIQKGVGVGWNFATLDERQIEMVLNKPWAVDGKNFSQRVWNNRQKLVNELNNSLTQNIILGQDPQKAIDEIAKKMNTSKSNAGRLVMTEKAFFSSASQKKCFGELDVEQYQILATLDSITSEICREMDGKHFPMSQWEVGVTAPPFHVWCRTTTVPYFDDEFDNVGERAARGEDGKVYYIPADMTYKEWKESFADSGDKSQYLRNNLPKNFIDTRNIGTVITDNDLQTLYEKADSYGIRMQGFETYCGDIQVLDDILKHINEKKTHFILNNLKTENIILNYDNVLGYLGDNSKIDIGAFAETRGKTITLNKFMFDDSEYLKKEYENALKNRYFAKGTSYLNIIDHEYGHILNKKNPKLYMKILDEIEKMAYNNGERIEDFIEKKISKYAFTVNSNADYSELISELYSMANGKEKEFALEIFRKAGILYED